MKRLLIIVTLLGLTALALLAGDIGGTWKGAFDFNGAPVPLTFTLKADAGKITGSVDGLPAGVAEIKEGKLEADKLTFWLTSEYQGMPIKLVYTGKVTDDQISFTFGTDDGSWSTQLVAKKN